MNVEFNASQERYANFVLNEVEEIGQQQVIFGCGLTGVGKTTVLSEIAGEIERKGGKIVTLDYLINPKNKAEAINSERHLVTSMSPRDFEVSQNGLIDYLGLPFLGVRVMAMNPEETDAYIEELRKKTEGAQLPSGFSNEIIAALTMGVYGHINKYFEYKARGEFYQPSLIGDALRADMPEDFRSGPGFSHYLNTLTDLSQLWGRMGVGE